MDRQTQLRAYLQIDTAKNWRKLSRRIAVDKYRGKLWTFTRSISAILVIPLVITSIVLLKDKMDYENRPVEQVTISSARGIVTKIILPDESEVWLNSGSTLSYPKLFTGTVRSVSLSGEAYFRVSADKANRFVVSTDKGLSVSAYGTEFNVCAYGDEQTIDATLVSGNMEVNIASSEKSDAVKIGREQQISFDKKSGLFAVKNISIAVETSWKDGKMIFRRANMDEVIRRLSRHYNVDIRLEDAELQDYEYSATFTTETLEEILYLLETSAPIKCKMLYPEQVEDYSFKKRTVIISLKK